MINRHEINDDPIRGSSAELELLIIADRRESLITESTGWLWSPSQGIGWAAVPPLVWIGPNRPEIAPENNNARRNVSEGIFTVTDPASGKVITIPQWKKLRRRFAKRGVPLATPRSKMIFDDGEMLVPKVSEPKSLPDAPMSVNAKQYLGAAALGAILFLFLLRR